MYGSYIHRTNTKIKVDFQPSRIQVIIKIVNKNYLGYSKKGDCMQASIRKENFQLTVEHASKTKIGE
ncbi:hypothetical protein ABH20_01760 [Geobacillus sp. T6]|nr:hypothetical protein ABH20_01760 [Geobacillus sp. T6]